MHKLRRVDLLWQGDDIAQYESLKEKANLLKKEMPEFIKEIIRKEIERNT